ncbi:MAG: helix-turn-helix domain-containing protein [Verrucomicrobiota bacterium]
MIFQRHLALQESVCEAAGEWHGIPDVWVFARLTDGKAYWLSRSQTFEPLAGDLLVLPPGCQGVLRASQVGPIKVQFFTMNIEAMSSLLTLAERQHLESTVARAWQTGHHLPAHHPSAMQFAGLVEKGNVSGSLPDRCHALDLAANVFNSQLSGLGAVTGADATARFADIIRQLTPDELVQRSVDDLARLCHCSLRHFSRLFHKHFGISVRARQTELRLQKARQLLSETDAKIIHVALDSGYRHLGLFNSTFKKHLGVTPSQWRLQQQRRRRPARRSSAAMACAAVLVGFLMLWFGNPACGADTNTPAGRLPLSATNQPTLELRGFRIEGNTLLPQDEIDAILNPHLGPVKTLADIQAALGELNIAYRARGFVTVAVALPKQELPKTNAIVRVLITEGRLSSITVVSNQHYSAANIFRALPSLKTNVVLNNLLLQQELERANANRDRQIYPRIVPGTEPGTSDLKLVVKDRWPLHARYDFNNASTPETPAFRTGLSVMYNNLWQYDHQFGVQYSMTPTHFKHDDVFPAVYDKPLIASYSAFYRMPLNLSGADRAQHNYGVSDFGYDEVSKRFRPPPYSENPELMFFASRSYSDTQEKLVSNHLTPTVIPAAGALQISDALYSQTLTGNEGLGARLQRPIDLDQIFGNGTTLFAALGVDFKRYRSDTLQRRMFQATIYVPPNPPGYGPPFSVFPSPPVVTTRSLESHVDYLPFSLNFEASRPDKYGSTTVSWNNSFNVASLIGSREDFRSATGSRDTTGDYYVANFAITREQRIYGDLAVRVRAETQYASEPLLSNEQFGMGGQAGPRGYRDGQLYADQGWRVMVEPHTRLLDVGMVDGTMPMLVRASLFMDYGSGSFRDPPKGASRSVDMWSSGFGFNATIGERWDFRLTTGWTLLSFQEKSAGSARTAFSVSVIF